MMAPMIPAAQAATQSECFFHFSFFINLGRGRVTGVCDPDSSCIVVPHIRPWPLWRSNLRQIFLITASPSFVYFNDEFYLIIIYLERMNSRPRLAIAAFLILVAVACTKTVSFTLIFFLYSSIPSYFF